MTSTENTLPLLSLIPEIAGLLLLLQRCTLHDSGMGGGGGGESSVYLTMLKKVLRILCSSKYLGTKLGGTLVLLRWVQEHLSA